MLPRHFCLPRALDVSRRWELYGRTWWLRQCRRIFLTDGAVAQLREDDQPLSLEGIKRKLPADLRQYLVPWQKETTQHFYANMSSDAWVDSPNLRGIDWGTGPAAAYLPIVLFMEANKAYDFAWVVEDDNRYIGDWGMLFSAALAVAAGSGDASELTEAISSGFEGFPGQGHPARDALPDFVSFTSINMDSDKWAATTEQLAGPYAESFLMVWGASRALFSAMHRRSMEGAFAYYETFMPTVALRENMTLVSLPLHNETFQCCSEAARHLYNDWFRSRTCQRLGLVHPIKLGDEWWS